MKIQVPEKCGLCASFKQINTNDFICGLPVNKAKEILDTTAFKISLDSRPNWCPIQEAVNNINNLSKEDKILFDRMCDGFSAMFELINNQKSTQI